MVRVKRNQVPVDDVLGKIVELKLEDRKQKEDTARKASSSKFENADLNENAKDTEQVPVADIWIRNEQESPRAKEVHEATIIPPPGSIWELHYDDEGTPFYWNTVQEDSQWEVPEELLAPGQMSPSAEEVSSLIDDGEQEEDILKTNDQGINMGVEEGHQSDEDAGFAEQQSIGESLEVEESPRYNLDDILENLDPEWVDALGKEQIEIFWKSFTKIDKDGSGFLDFGEFEELMNEITGRSPEDRNMEDGEDPHPEATVLRMLFDQVDTDNSNALNFVECLQVFRLLSGNHHEGKFMAAMEKIPQDLANCFSETKIRELFDFFAKIDSDGSGQLDQNELRELVALVSKARKPPSNKQMKKLIKEVDTDNDGVVSFLEFLVVYKNMESGKKTELGKIFEASQTIMMLSEAGKEMSAEMNQYKTLFNNWRNAKKIEQEEARRRKLERARKRKEDEEKRERDDHEFYKAFMEEQRKREAEREMPIKGVDIKILYPGDNSTYPEAGDTCTVHYVGLLNGKEFASTRAVGKGTPFSFVLGRYDVLKGWELAFKKLSVGCKVELVLDSQLCYGQQGLPPLVPPNSNLTFVIDLLRVDSNDEHEDENDDDMSIRTESTNHDINYALKLNKTAKKAGFTFL